MLKQRYTCVVEFVEWCVYIYANVSQQLSDLEKLVNLFMVVLLGTTFSRSESGSLRNNVNINPHDYHKYSY